MSTTEQAGSAEAERRVSPADVQNVRFAGGSMLHPGYSEIEVDRFLNRVAQEIGRLHAEKAELRDRVHALQARLSEAEEAAEQAAVPEPPSDQAVRLLASAQQTADQYVAEAEDFSRQMTADARARYEEQLKHARETAGAIIQAAHEQATHMTGDEERVVAAAQPAERHATTEELEEQVAYLKAFAQACRTQLRAYLEALLTDVESEWGKADPVALPPAPIRAPAQRGAPRAQASPEPQQSNVAREMPLSDATSEHPVITPEGTVEVRRS